MELGDAVYGWYVVSADELDYGSVCGELRLRMAV